jgi:signal transduction histidine kinase
MYSTLVAAWQQNANRLTVRDRVIDSAIALLAFSAAVGIMFSHGLGEPVVNTRDGDALGVALLALACVPLAFRRIAPSLVLVLMFVAVVPAVALRYPGELSNLPLIGVYSLAAAGDRDPVSGRAAKALAAGGFVALAIAVVATYDDGFPAPELLAEGALWLAIWIAGDRTRLRRERIAELEERVLRAEREAERERRLAAAEERTQIARELHDSAGHAMNVILVEAGAARLLRERDPERSRSALETIEQVARGTLEEIDRMVRHLREYGRADEAPAAPLPGLRDIDALVERERAAGRPVTTHVEGEARRLPADVDRAAYRIVQEALMNAVKHGSGSADVVVAYGPTALEVSVTNPLRPTGVEVPLIGLLPANGFPQAGGGHGIVGMRERASLLGGSLEARGEDGVFRVRALLPYKGEPA